MTDEVSKEIVEKMKSLPVWIIEPEVKSEDGHYIWEIKCFDETIKMKELTGYEYESASSFAEKMGHDETKVLLQRSVVDKTSLELDDMRGKKYLRLKSALTYVYGMHDF